MGARQKQEIQDLETQIREGRAYIVAMREALKLVPREGFTGAETLYRKGSLADKAQRAIAAHGAPMHIDDLVVAMRVKQDAKSKRSVAGTLASYVRKGEIFNRPAPNTFGLIGMEAEDDSDGESGTIANKARRYERLLAARKDMGKRRLMKTEMIKKSGGT